MPAYIHKSEGKKIIPNKKET